MNTIKVDGVVYTKAALLAKEFRYTTDYIGQLCRGNKVDCQLVGRAWYVSEASLLQHKDARYKEVRSAEKTSNIAVRDTAAEEVISVTPRLKRVTAKQITAPKSHYLTRLGAYESKYYVDDSELLPQPLRSSPRITPILPKIPEKIEIKPVESVPVKFSSTTKPAKLEFTPLPEVPLQGELLVEEVVLPEVSAPVTLADIEELRPNPATKEILPTETRIAKMSRSPHSSASVSVSPFTPQAVTTHSASSAHRFLVPLALLASVTFFLFVTVAFQSMVIVENKLSATIMFSLDGLRELLLRAL